MVKSIILDKCQFVSAQVSEKIGTFFYIIKNEFSAYTLNFTHSQIDKDYPIHHDNAYWKCTIGSKNVQSTKFTYLFYFSDDKQNFQGLIKLSKWTNCSMFE